MDTTFSFLTRTQIAVQPRESRLCPEVAAARRELWSWICQPTADLPEEVSRAFEAAYLMETRGLPPAREALYRRWWLWVSHHRADLVDFLVKLYRLDEEYECESSDADDCHQAALGNFF